MSYTLYAGNDNLLQLVGLTDQSSGAAINDAVVQLTLRAVDGTPVAGQTWPLAMAYVAQSAGDYRAGIGPAVALVAGRSYIAEIDADAGVGRRGFWRVPLVVRERVV